MSKSAFTWLSHLKPHLTHSVTPADWMLVRNFESEVQEVLAAARRDDAFVLCDPLSVKRELARRGYGGLDIRVSDGGDGRSAILQALVQFVCGYHDVDLRDAAHTGHGRLIASAGDPEQRRLWLPRLLDGELAGIAVTERTGGSNVRRMRTTAKSGVLVGEKCWISRIQEASAFIVFFRAHDQMTAAIVDANAPGLTRESSRPEGLSGWSWGSLRFDNVPIERHSLLGAPITTDRWWRRPRWALPRRLTIRSHVSSTSVSKRG
jgi:alkylation response protein AidB-like acyl-CoA dehydrogenase